MIVAAKDQVDLIDVFRQPAVVGKPARLIFLQMVIDPFELTSAILRRRALSASAEQRKNTAPTEQTSCASAQRRDRIGAEVP